MLGGIWTKNSGVGQRWAFASQSKKKGRCNLVTTQSETLNRGHAELGLDKGGKINERTAE